MENMAGVRQLIDRQPIPPRLRKLIEDIESKATLTVDSPPEKGANEVRQILQLVDGPNLLAGIVACIIAYIPVDEDELVPPNIEDSGVDGDDDDEQDDDGNVGEGEAGAEGDGSGSDPGPSPADNDQVLEDRDGNLLIEKGGGHYTIRKRDGEEISVRGKAKAEDLFNEIAS